MASLLDIEAEAVLTDLSQASDTNYLVSKEKNITRIM